MTRIPFALRAGTALVAVAIASSAGAQSTVPPEDVQQTPATASDQTTQGGDIVITGSRIRRDPLSQDQPIVFVDQEDMQKTGLSSVNDILQRLPSSGGGLNDLNVLMSSARWTSSNPAVVSVSGDVGTAVATGTAT